MLARLTLSPSPVAIAARAGLYDIGFGVFALWTSHRLLLTHLFQQAA
jgi:hypothetical protein